MAEEREDNKRRRAAGSKVESQGQGPQPEQLGHIGEGEGFVSGLRQQGGSGRRAGRHSAPEKRSPKKRIILALVVLAGAAAVGFWSWHQMQYVQVSVNGTSQDVKIGTTVDRIVQEDGISATAGNLVSITGTLLQEGQGDPYDVQVNGKDLGYSAGSAYAVEGDEHIQIGDGEDKVEDSSEEEVTEAPKLEIDGKAGAITYVSQWGSPTVKKVRKGSVSGETQDIEIEQQGQDCILTKTNIEPSGGQKLVALTFDDGPSKYTKQYLQILADHGAVATFFNLGQSVAADPADAQAIIASGCQIASHTYSHLNLPKQDADTVNSELSIAFDAIASATGVTTSIFRPPYGAFTSDSWIASAGAATVSVIWNKDSEDWKKPGVDKIVSNACDNIKSGNIILMHDGGGNRDEDVEALPKIIDNLHAAGYTFVTISDLMKSDDSIPEDIADGTAKMPDWAVWPDSVA